MKFQSIAGTLALFAVALGAATCLAQVAPADVPAGTPEAVIDLTSAEGATQVNGTWRYSDTRVVRVPFRAPGADGQPGARRVTAYDIEPKAGAAGFDDSRWQRLDPAQLAQRRTNGKLAFNWYRISVTVPERVDDFDTRGSTLVLETAADDYAEVWVDGELPRAAGQAGGSVVAGWNAPNRLVIGRDVQPGRKIQLAIFGINGPLSGSPTNYVYLRTAKLEFHRGAGGPHAVAPHEVNVDVVRKDAQLDEIVPLNPKLYKLAEGFQFTEGPVWVRGGSGQGGHLLFSDPNANTIYRYADADGLAVFRTPSGYSGDDIAEYRQPGSNGLTLDAQGRLTVNEHGNRRITRTEADGSLTVLAERYDGKRLNSPNDLVYRSDGSLYFTDPNFGLPKFGEDPRKELPIAGVYRLAGDRVELLTDEFSGPNGIAFSPDEKFLYVGNWDDHSKIVKRFPVHADGSLGKGEVFVDMTHARGDDAIDGIKVDVKGNVYVSGPGGLWVISPKGKHLGTIVTPRHPHNMAWGDEDGKSLYLAAQSGLYRIRLNVAGVRP